MTDIDIRPVIEAAVEAERERIVSLLRKVDHWHELDWVIAHLTGKGPEPVMDSFGMLSLPAEAEADNGQS